MQPASRRGCALVLLSVLSCTPAFGATITFIHYNDPHAHLTPHADLVQNGTTTTTATRGGLARIATVIKQIRAQNPASVQPPRIPPLLNSSRSRCNGIRRAPQWSVAICGTNTIVRMLLSEWARWLHA